MMGKFPAKAGEANVDLAAYMDDHANHDEYYEGCFKCKIQTIGFDRSKIRAVPKGKSDK